MMNRTNIEVRHARRGLALLLVLGIVAVASILGWAMLSSASMRAQVEATTADSIDAQYLSESGISYAMYYLMYPAKSAVAVKQGTYNAYWPGQAGLTLWSDARGTVDTSVTNTGDGQFSIASSTTVNGIKRTLIADAAYSYNRYKVTHALALNNTAPFTIPTNMTINGAVVTRGGVIGATGNLSNSGPMTPAGANVTPAYAELTLAQETLTAAKKKAKKSSDRDYTYDGQDYTAEEVPSNSLTGTLATSDPSTNPMNVWYCDNDLAINNFTLNGTLVTRATKKLTVTGANTITPVAVDMPALLCDTLDMRQTATASRLTVNGVVWIGSTITNSNYLQSVGWLRINGALLFGSTSPAIGTTFIAPLTVTYVATAAKIPQMSTVKTIKGIGVSGWRQGT